MKAIILAAGRGTRLYPLTLDKPKCLLKINGKTILDRQIEAIREIGIKDILIVTGYKKELIEHAVGNEARCKEYLGFEKTNNLHTLWSIKNELNNNFMCFFSDLIFDTEVIKRAKESPCDICLVVDTYKVLEGTMRIKLVNGNLRGVGDYISVSNGSGNFIGIAKFSKKGARMLCEQMKKMVSAHTNDYYTIAIDSLIKAGIEIGYVEVGDCPWIEIDTKEDLDNADKLLSSASIS